MRRPTPVLVAALAALLLLGACSDDGGSSSGDRPTSTTQAPSELPKANDPAMHRYLVAAADLPAGFAASSDVDDTVTSFCAGQDAAAGLAASARAIVGYTRTPAGASVVHLVFRFHPGDAERFVDQATTILRGCSDVPDIQGLAFTYEPSAASVDATVDPTDAHVTRHGTSVGKGDLSVDIAVFRQGDVGELVAVLTAGAGRADTDALAVAAFSSAVRRAPVGDQD